MPEPRRVFSSLVVVLVLVAAYPRTGSAAPQSTSQAGPSAAYVPGNSYLSAHGYVEYIAGNAPVILTAPHGGSLVPASIPDRTAERCGGSATTTTDVNTIELARAMQARYFARFGKYPHVVIAHISRRKLDANRTEPEATCDNPEAEAAFGDWEAFIDAAKRAVLQSFGKGWYMDVHGHGHKIQRLEIAYLIASSDLQLSDAKLNAVPGLTESASVATIVKESSLSLAAMLRGPTSLGTLYANNGFPSLPSAQDPRPDGAPYYAAGENLRRNGCGAEATSYGGVSGGEICGVQIEVNYTGVRDNAANRNRFGDATATVLEQFLSTHWGLQLRQ